MIQPLNNQNKHVATEMRKVFQASYAIEAELLGAADFPPLKRTMEDYMSCDNSFLGYFKDQELAGAIELDRGEEVIHIQSLVVHPKFFRQGIGRKLVEHVLASNPTIRFTVETGLDNRPAIRLYEQLGFTEISQYDTDQ